MKLSGNYGNNLIVKEVEARWWIKTIGKIEMY